MPKKTLSAFALLLTVSLTAGGTVLPQPAGEGVEPLPLVPGLDADYVDGKDSADFAVSGHDHDDRYYTIDESEARFSRGGQVLVAVVPWSATTFQATCDGGVNPFPDFALSFETTGPSVVDVTSAVNAVIDGQTQTGIRLDGMFFENSMDIFTMSGRATLNAGWAAEVGPGAHTVQLDYRCLSNALFDNSGRLIVRVLPV